MALYQRQPAPAQPFEAPICPHKATIANNDTPVRSVISPTALQQTTTPELFYPPPRYFAVKKLALVFSDFITEGALRHLIWQAEAYEKVPKSGLKSNGFLSVIVRPPGQRKVLLDRVEFEKWLTSQHRDAR